MDEFARIWEHLAGRLHGPLTLRLVVQPLVACILAIRAGLRDARENKPAYFWAVVSNPAHRRELIREGWKDIAKVFILAVVLDVVYQFIQFRALYLGEALLVATLLAIIPYLLVRGPVTRLAKRHRP
jgi:hypothetical protein